MRANAPQLPGGGSAQLELPDALSLKVHSIARIEVILRLLNEQLLLRTITAIDAESIVISKVTVLLYCK